MRIKHRPNEFFAVASMWQGESVLFKDVERWYPFKHYRTKQSALNAVKRLKEKHKPEYGKLYFKIVYNPYPFCSDDEKIDVYNELHKGGNTACQD